MIVGRVLGTADLGQYRYAYRIASLPSLAVITICSHVLFPAFSRISGDSSRFRAAFLRALGWIWFAALPVGALSVVVGRAGSGVAARRGMARRRGRHCGDGGNRTGRGARSRCPRRRSRVPADHRC